MARNSVKTLKYGGSSFGSARELPNSAVRWTLRNYFADMDCDGEGRARWIQLGLGAGIVIVLAVFLGSMLRPVANDWPRAFAPAVFVGAAVLGLRRGQSMLQRIGSMFSTGWLDVLPAPTRAHWTSIRKLALAGVMLEAAALLLVSTACSLSAELPSPAMLTAGAVSVFVVASCGWIIVAVGRRQHAYPTASLFESNHCISQQDPVVRMDAARHSSYRFGVARLGLWQRRSVPVRRERGIMLMFGVVAVGMEILLSRNELPSFIVVLLALLYSHSLAYFLMRAEPAASHVLRTSAVGFRRLAWSLMRLPFAASTGAFGIFLTVALLLSAVPDPWLWAVAFGALIALNLLAACCMLCAPAHRFSGDMRYLAATSLTVAVAQATGPLAVVVYLVAVVWLFRRASRRFRNA